MEEMVILLFGVARAVVIFHQGLGWEITRRNVFDERKAVV